MPEEDTLKQWLNLRLKDYFKSPHLNANGSLHKVYMQEVEKLLLEGVLDFTKKNHSKAAEILGISRTTLRKKAQLYQL